MYYAVKNGRKVGIFSDWNECKDSIYKFPNAIYKKFANFSDAELFLRDKEDEKLAQMELEANSLVAYVDGSFSQDKLLASFGVVLIENEEVKQTYSGKVSEDIEMRNVAGELAGVMKALEYALENNYTHIYIYYDYLGIKAWAEGEWKANKEGTKNYQNFIKHISNKLKISFFKVKSHSGDKYNDMADELAKKELGISL